VLVGIGVPRQQGPLVTSPTSRNPPPPGLCVVGWAAACGSHAGAHAVQAMGSRLTPRWKFDRR